MVHIKNVLDREVKLDKATLVSLFTGAGGLDVGFGQAGFDTIWANDLNADACATFDRNHSEGVIRCGPLDKFIHQLDDGTVPRGRRGGPPRLVGRESPSSLSRSERREERPCDRRKAHPLQPVRGRDSPDGINSLPGRDVSASRTVLLTPAALAVAGILGGMK